MFTLERIKKGAMGEWVFIQAIVSGKRFPMEYSPETPLNKIIADLERQNINVPDFVCYRDDTCTSPLKEGGMIRSDNMIYDKALNLLYVPQIVDNRKGYVTITP